MSSTPPAGPSGTRSAAGPAAGPVDRPVAGPIAGPIDGIKSGAGGDSAPVGLSMATAPTLDDIDALARQALATIPPALQPILRDLVFCVVDFPDDDTIAALALDSPFDLLGLYHGVDLSVQSVGDLPQDVNRVLLYRRPILDYWCESGEDLGHLVRHVLIHEIGHHAGLSDADMERIEQEA